MGIRKRGETSIWSFGKKKIVIGYTPMVELDLM